MWSLIKSKIMMQKFMNLILIIVLNRTFNFLIKIKIKKNWKWTEIRLKPIKFQKNPHFAQAKMEALVNARKNSIRVIHLISKIAMDDWDTMDS